jgi:hypothetical protein
MASSVILDTNEDGMAINQDEGQRPWTLSVPAAGKKYLGLGRNASYRAAQRGDIPTIVIGGLLKVPVIRMERLLAGDQDKA